MELKSRITERAAGACARHWASFLAIPHCPKGTGEGLLRFSPSGSPFCGPAQSSHLLLPSLPVTAAGTVTSAFPMLPSLFGPINAEYLHSTLPLQKHIVYFGNVALLKAPGATQGLPAPGCLDCTAFLCSQRLSTGYVL